MSDIFAPFKPLETPSTPAIEQAGRKPRKPAKPTAKTKGAAANDPAREAQPAPNKPPRKKKPVAASPILKISLADMAVISATLRPDDYEPFGSIYEQLLNLPAVTRTRVLLAIQKAFA